MSNEEIERFIAELDSLVTEQELCVYPDKQTLDCCDCYLCHIDFYNKARDELKKQGRSSYASTYFFTFQYCSIRFPSLSKLLANF